MSVIDFEEKKIALLGDPKICRHFYLQFHRVMNIKYLFTASVNFSDSLTDVFFADQLEVVSLSVKTSLLADGETILILCVEHTDRNEYDRLLYLSGLEWGKDYLEFEYVVHFYRHKYNLNLLKKNIWIFGAGNNGNDFYVKYKDSLRICGFISNYDEEKNYKGLPVVRLSEILKMDDLYIVVCSDADVLMVSQLTEIGMKGDRDYGFAEMIPKNLFIAMGTCQIIKVAEVLKGNKSFASRYYMDLYFENYYEPCNDADNKRIKLYGKYCDVVFYNIANAGTLEFRNYDFVVQNFYPLAVRFYLPFYYFKGQIMQATDTVNKYTAKLLEGSWMWFRGDREINRMLENEDSIEYIIEKISGENYWTKQEILDNFKHELKKIAVLDRFSSFPLRPCIEKNYQKFLIFLDGTHFSVHLCLYLANKIAEYLHLNFNSEENEPDKEEYSYTGIMPVYPCVRRALGMKTGEFCQFYNMESKRAEYLDLKEYVEKYVQYTVCINKIYGEYGTIMSW